MNIYFPLGCFVAVLGLSSAPVGASPVSATLQASANPMLRSAVPLNPVRQPVPAVPLLVAPQGVTAFAGRVVDQAGTGIANAAITDGAITTLTDAQGRYLLTNVSPGASLLRLDARHGVSGDYGYYILDVAAVQGQTTQVPYASWLPKLDHTRDVTIASPTRSETVVTNAAVPGVELHLPAGAVIKDSDGKLVKKINIATLPADRTPFPVPRAFKQAPSFTIQPGGITITDVEGRPLGAELHFPNSEQEPSGARARVWHYEPKRGGWRPIGHAVVDRDGTQIITDEATQIADFNLVGTDYSLVEPSTGPVPGGVKDGQSVDLASGLWVHQMTDLSVKDVLPLDLTRTYRQNDSNVHAFGVGMTMPWEVTLNQYNAGVDTTVTFSLPDGGAINYQVIPNPLSVFDLYLFEQYQGGSFAPFFTDYIASETPTDYLNSKILWSCSNCGRTLQRQDGMTYNYSAQLGYLQSISDRFGNAVKITYNSSGSISSISSPNGRWIQFNYNTNYPSVISSATDNSGRTVYYRYNVDTTSSTTCCYLTQVYNADQAITAQELSSGTALPTPFITYNWDYTNNRIVSIQDEHLHYLVQLAYWPCGGNNGPGTPVKTQTLIDNTTYSFSYDFNNYCGGPSSFSATTTVTDPLGHQRVVSFNSNGYVTADVQASDTTSPRSWSYQLDPTTNQVHSATDPTNAITQWTYTPNGYVATKTSNFGTGLAATATYTPSPYYNQVAQITDENKFVTKFGVNQQGVTTSIERGASSGDKRTITYQVPGSAYDGQPQLFTDALGDTLTLGYDHGLLSSVTDALGNQTSYFHDAVGRLAQITDPLGNITQMTFDPVWGVKSIIDPLQHKISTSYTEIGDVETYTDQNTNVTAFDYDVNNRLYARKDALLVKAYYTSYDGMGNLLSMTDRNGNISKFTWDDFGDLLTGSFADGSSTSYGWDKLGRLTSAADTTSGTLTRKWTTANPFSFSDAFGSGAGVSGTVVPSWSANGLAASLSVTGPDKVALSYAFKFDSAMRFYTATATKQSNTVTELYDAADRPQSLSLPNGIVANYTYDAADHLTALTYMNGSTTVGTLTYQYDADGRVSNRGGSLFQSVLPSGSAVPTLAAYNVDNRLTSWTTASGSVTPKYDANGNLVCDNYSSTSSTCIGRVLDWDSRNRLTSVTSGTSTLASYSYDALNRRITTTAGGSTSATLYDGRYSPIQLQSGTSVTANVWPGLGIDQRFAFTTSSGTSTYLPDLLGSTTALTSASAAIQTSYGYDPTGISTTTGAQSSNIYLYAGQVQDSSGYNYARSRYYNPQIERYLAENPIDFAGLDANLYRYAAGNPVNLVDPTGTSSCNNARSWGAIPCITGATGNPRYQAGPWLFASNLPRVSAPCLEDPACVSEVNSNVSARSYLIGAPSVAADWHQLVPSP